MLNGCKKNDDKPINSTNGITSAVFNPDKSYGTLTDQDGNIYKTITIGTQTWMAENLRTTKYRNGEAITEVTNNASWANLITGAYCNHGNTKNNDTIATYGRLYNWYAVNDSRNVAPVGWHVTTDSEWSNLVDYLGSDSVAGRKMKETGVTHWHISNTDATNESGFTALPAGYYSSVNNHVMYLSYGSYYWSNSQEDVSFAWSYYIYSNKANCFRGSWPKTFGFSVRCVKD